ncbi:MAG: CHAT domain-containing protein [Verrucomicrobiales bacterium]|nr:CHAT domain-containing protein [Verrucomicrobiales bacterium]
MNAQGIQILAAPQEVAFPGGYEVVKQDGTVIKRINGPARANVQAYLDSNGVRYFMSDWSYQRYASGKAANWMRATAVPNPPPRQPVARNDGVVPLKRILAISFPQGVLIYDNNGRLLKREPSMKEANVSAYKDTNGERYWVSDWSWQRYRDEGKPPNWIAAIRKPKTPSKPAPPVVAEAEWDHQKAPLWKVGDLQRRGQFVEALEMVAVAEKTVTGRDDRSLLFYRKSEILMALGQWDAARNSCKQWIAAAKGGGEGEIEYAMLNYARVLEHLGDDRTALKYYDLAAEGYDQIVFYRARLAHRLIQYAFLRYGDFQRYESFIKKNSEPDDAAGRSYLYGEFQGESDVQSKAELDTLLAKIRREKSYPAGLQGWVQGMVKLGLVEEARREVAQLEKRYGNKEDLGLHFGRAWSRLGDQRRSQSAYLSAIPYLEKKAIDDQGDFEHVGDEEAYFAEMTEAYINAGQAGKVIPFLQRRYGDLSTLDPGVPAIVHEAVQAGALFSNDQNLRRKITGRTIAETRNRMERILTRFPEQDRLTAVKTFRPLDVPFSIGDPVAAAQAILQFKGIVLDSLAREKLRLSKVAVTRDKIGLIDELEKLREVYLKQELEGTPPHLLKNLDSRISTLENQLFGRTAATSTSIDLDAFTVERISNRLAGDQAVAEFALYRHLTGFRRFEDRYAVVVFKRGEQPALFSLGKAEIINRKVRELRKWIEGNSESDDIVRELYALVWKPIEKELTGVNQLYVSLDGALHGVPMAALVDAKGKFATEKWKIQQVGSSRDLLITNPRPARKEAFLLGNPDFSARLRKPRSKEPEFATQHLRNQLNRAAGKRSFDLATPLEVLAGTAREIDLLEDLLKADKYQVKRYDKSTATESSIHFDSPPDIVHFATHGLFLRENKEVRNPMARSFLALAGADHTLDSWKQGKVPDPASDGILMAAEAVTLNLTGTRLVVLSACETGLGDEVRSEGVMGLKRALRHAGAENLVTTLWPIADEPTVEFMNRFYHRIIKDGKSPGEALAETQAVLLRKYREESDLASAVYLAGPFVIDVSGK